MIYQLIFVVTVTVALVFYASWKRRTKIKEINLFRNQIDLENNQFHPISISDSENLSYEENFEALKSQYPFEKWRDNYKTHGMIQYTEDICNEAQLIFDTLIDNLKSLGTNANIHHKEELFKVAVLALNKLNEIDESIIETSEREDLCILIDKISITAGLNPEDYSNGGGIADEWREW